MLVRQKDHRWQLYVVQSNAALLTCGRTQINERQRDSNRPPLELRHRLPYDLFHSVAQHLATDRYLMAGFFSSDLLSHRSTKRTSPTPQKYNPVPGTESKKTNTDSTIAGADARFDSSRQL